MTNLVPIPVAELEPIQRKHPLAKCEQCPLAGPENAFVPSYGPDKVKVVAVGEAPGFQEAEKGIPFIGPSGRLLTTVLKHHRLKRPDVFFTNACLCRPPENATPPKEAVNACSPRLLHEINSREPEFVLALGNTAARAILGTTEGITRLRVGPGRTTSNVPGAVVIPTWHPAYCLRNADSFPHLVDDIGKIYRGSRTPWEEPSYQVAEEPAQALHVLEQLSAMPIDTTHFDVDIECDIEKDVSFGHPSQFDMLCIGIMYSDTDCVVIGKAACHDPEVIKALANFFDPAAGRKFDYQNGKFDNEGLYPLLKVMPKVYFDTMLAHYALDERPGNHSLEYMGIELLGAPDWKNEVKKHIPKGGTYADIPLPVLYKYNAFDLKVTRDLRLLFTPLLEVQGEWPYDDVPYKSLRDVHDHMVEAGNELAYLELNGITVNKAVSDELQDSYLEILGGIEDRINNIVSKAKINAAIKGGMSEVEARSIYENYALNPRSPKQVKEFIHERGATFVTGTDKDILERLLKRVRPGSSLAEFITTLLEHRYSTKRYGTYVKGIRKRMYRGRVYTTYLLHGSTSGRLASRNPNLQNIVRDTPIRRQFGVSKPGNILGQCDYKQAEGRVICWLARDEYLQEKFANPDIDIFNDLSNDLYGDGHWSKEERVRTKAFFYGIGYGREYYSIALEFNMSLPDAAKRYNAFMDLIPKTAAWQQSIKDRVLGGKDLITPFGRHRRFWLITEANKKDVLNEALSFIPQSTASDICLRALIRLRPALRGLAFIRLTIHDALVFECLEERKDEVAAIVQEVMMEEAAKITTYVPFPVDVSFGPTWGDL